MNKMKKHVVDSTVYGQPIVWESNLHSSQTIMLQLKLNDYQLITLCLNMWFHLISNANQV